MITPRWGGAYGDVPVGVLVTACQVEQWVAVDVALTPEGDPDPAAHLP